MPAYYNEINPYAAQWLRNLISAGHIVAGDVDERSIEDVRPDDLVGYHRAHFFAGIGVWSHAARIAGIPDDFPFWSGSCPCQPFSSAGKGEGFADERHLWPSFHHLISVRRPAVVVGEQVSSKDGLAWFDLVHADMEAEGYAVGALDTCAAGVGAPHIRQRLYWAAHANDAGLEGRVEPGRERAAELLAGAGGVAGGLADADRRERDGIADGEGRQPDGSSTGRVEGNGEPERGGATGGLADAALCRERAFDRESGQSVQPQVEVRGRDLSVGLADAASCGRGEERPHGGGIAAGDRAEGLAARPVDGGGDMRPGPTNGIWRDADWLHCRDGKWRPVEPGTFPLASGIANRVGRLRAYGNTLCAHSTAAFLEVALEHRP